MAKRNTKFKKGSFYHIYNRGANRSRIFFERQNYLFLLRNLKEYSCKYSISIIAYCLMPNHYHFLLQQNSDIPVNIPIAYLFNSYSKAVNKKYERKGTLFEGPFKSIEIEEERYLIELCRYIHRNPIDDNLVNNILDWEFSNYPEWIGKRSGILYDDEFRKKYFLEYELYEKFVLDYCSYKQARNELREHMNKIKKGIIKLESQSK